MRTKRIKQYFQAAGAATITAGAVCVIFGIWVAFFKSMAKGLAAVPDLISGAIFFTLAVIMMRFGRDMISYYRIK